MELTNKNLEAILKAPALRKEILAELFRQGAPNDILDKPIGKLDKHSLDLLHSTAYDALIIRASSSRVLRQSRTRGLMPLTSSVYRAPTT
jgi:hypothetical protein